MLRNLLSVLLIPIVLSACASYTPSTPDYFLVLRDVPESPSFVVIPFNSYLEQVEYANRIEESLIKAGAVVQQRPHVRDIVEEKQMGAGTAAATNDEVNAQSGELKTTEAYSVYDGVTADYVVYTEKNERRIRVERRTSNELVSVFKLHKWESKSDAMIVELVKKLNGEVVK